MQFDKQVQRKALCLCSALTYNKKIYAPPKLSSGPISAAKTGLPCQFFVPHENVNITAHINGNVHANTRGLKCMAADYGCTKLMQLLFTFVFKLNVGWM